MLSAYRGQPPGWRARFRLAQTRAASPRNRRFRGSPRATQGTLHRRGAAQARDRWRAGPCGASQTDRKAARRRAANGRAPPGDTKRMPGRPASVSTSARRRPRSFDELQIGLATRIERVDPDARPLRCRTGELHLVYDAGCQMEVIVRWQESGCRYAHEKRELARLDAQAVAIFFGSGCRAQSDGVAQFLRKARGQI